MLLGINGRLGSGKDTVLARLRVISDKFVRHAFADKLKISAMASLGFRHIDEEFSRTDEELIALANLIKTTGIITIKYVDEDGDPCTKVITGREYLQFSGTEGGRDVFGNDFWVSQAMGSALEDVRQGRRVALTDLRFPEEAQAIIEHGGEIWRIVGDNEDTGDHPSEQPLDEKYITNGITIDNTVRDDGFKHLDAQLTRLVKERIEDT